MRPSYNEPAPTVDETQEKRVSTGDWSRVDQAVETIQGRGGAGDAPLFLYVGLNQPHPVFRTSRYYLDRIPEELIDLP
jgi:hypothetical protein